ncbi:MAG TPA: lysine 2,3-aminomutase, partial [Firmicutes bacterium]|nr:lysine 2,3-aminomutase [Bacillota bacterium]
MNKKQIARNRADELENRIQDYLDVKDTIPRGMAPTQQGKSEEKKEKILAHLKGTEENWNDYRWQLKNRISDVDTLRKLI